MSASLHVDPERDPPCQRPDLLGDVRYFSRLRGCLARRTSSSWPLTSACGFPSLAWHADRKKRVSRCLGRLANRENQRLGRGSYGGAMGRRGQDMGRDLYPAGGIFRLILRRT